MNTLSMSANFADELLTIQELLLWTNFLKVEQ